MKPNCIPILACNTPKNGIFNFVVVRSGQLREKNYQRNLRKRKNTRRNWIVNINVVTHTSVHRNTYTYHSGWRW